MRLIDADALRDETMKRYCEECDRRKGIKNGKYRIIYEIGDAPCRACGTGDMIEELEDAPTVEERKTGKWIKAKRSLWSVGICSVCGAISVEADTANYCKNCGSRMEDEP